MIPLTIEEYEEEDIQEELGDLFEGEKELRIAIYHLLRVAFDKNKDVCFDKCSTNDFLRLIIE